MTAIHRSPATWIRELTAEELRERLDEALQLYVNAMWYPPGTARLREPMWRTHMLRPDWRCVAAFTEHDVLAGIAYGYRGTPGQWWHEQVHQGLIDVAPPHVVSAWIDDYFELSELHVAPEYQGNRIGESLMRRLLDGVDDRVVLLSTPEGTSRAWQLYRRMGFLDVLRNYQFAGDSRPFAVLGRTLPLDTPR